MSYASIMVAVDLGEQGRQRVRLAGHVADDFHARLIGVAAEMPIYAAAPAGPTAGSCYSVTSIQEAVLNDLRLAHEAFTEASAGRSRVEWRSNLDLPLSFLVEQAAAADLIIVGRGNDDSPLLAVDPGDAVMRLGRPLLIVPPGVDYLEAKRVAIGWKNTRETRRAVRDALPFLKRASRVDVIVVNERDKTGDAQEVVNYLQAHDVHATVARTDPMSASTAEALVDAASQSAADLIVTGAYGHSRLREWTFGGVTRDLLNAAPVCCLMSH